MKKKPEITILLKCKKCRDENDYPLDLFPASLRKQYLKDGSVSQYCTYCNANTPHIIIGLEVTQEIPLQQEEVIKQLKKKDWKKFKDIR